MRELINLHCFTKAKRCNRVIMDFSEARRRFLPGQAWLEGSLFPGLKEGSGRGCAMVLVTLVLSHVLDPFTGAKDQSGWAQGIVCLRGK